MFPSAQRLLQYIHQILTGYSPRPKDCQISNPPTCNSEVTQPHVPRSHHQSMRLVRIKYSNLLSPEQDTTTFKEGL